MAAVKEFEHRPGGQTDHDRLLQQRRLHQLARLCAFQAPFLLFYFILRLWSIVSHGNWAAWLFLASEFTLATPWIVQWHDKRSLYELGRTSKPTRVIGNDVPSVDVLLPCAGEAIEIVLDTVRAACNLSYPREKYRVIVLDDMASNETKDAIEALKLEYSNLYYMPHPSDITTFSKAANLNSGLSFVSELNGGPSEFVAGLDIDMIPEPGLLRALLPPMLKDHKVGGVGSPQHFYNIPPTDPLRQYPFWALYTFVQIPNLNLSEKAILSGSGWLFRRAALDAVGQFCVDSTTEDVFLSLQLLSENWKLVSVTEQLQYGLLPNSMSHYLRQKRRWAVGSFQTMLFLDRQFSKNTSWARRMVLQVPIKILTFSRFAPYPASVSILLVLVSRHNLMPSFAGRPWEAIMLSVALIQYAGIAAQGSLHAILCHRKISSLDTMSELWLGPQMWSTLINVYLPKWLRYSRFEGEASGAVTRRNSQGDISSTKRMKRIFWNHGVWAQLLYLLLCAASVVFVINSNLSTNQPSSLAVQKRLRAYSSLSSVAFPPLVFHLYHSLTLALIPVRYAFSTPFESLPREDLLIRDEVTKVAHPKETTKDSLDSKSLFGFDSAFGAMVFAFFIVPMAIYWCW